MRLYYVRHGDPVYNPNQLTPLGKLQAQAVAKRLAQQNFDKIFCSTSNRAVETAQPLCDLLKKDMELLDWCNEKYCFNEFSVVNDEGKRSWGVADPKTRMLLNSPEIIEMGQSWFEHPAFRDTGFKSGTLRINRETDRFLERFGYYRDEENLCYRTDKDYEGNIAFFAHNGVGFGMISHILGIPYPNFSLHFTMHTSSVSVIDFTQTHGVVIPTLDTFSNDSHIYREGYPTKY